MTLGGLALAIGILVDEATVEVENIHTQFVHTDHDRPGRAAGQRADGRAAAAGDALHPGRVPAVVLHGRRGPRAVRAAVAGRRLLDDGLLHPVQHVRAGAVGLAACGTHHATRSRSSVGRLRAGFRAVAATSWWRVALAAGAGYLVACAAIVLLVGGAAGHGDLSARRRRASSACGCGPPTARTSSAPSRSRSTCSKVIEEKVGPRQRRHDAGLRRHDSLDLPDQRRLPVDARAGGGAAARGAQARQRHPRRGAEGGAAPASWPRGMPELRLSFEPADIINEVMSFGSPTPIEVAVSGPNLADNRAVRREASARSWRRSRRCATCNSPSRSTIRPSRCSVDREKAGLSGVAPADVARSLVAATSSSRFVVPNYWPDPQDRHRLPGAGADSASPDQEHRTTWKPCRSSGTSGKELLLQDVADVQAGTHARPVRPLQHAAAGEPDGQHRRRGPGRREPPGVARPSTQAGEPPQGRQSRRSRPDSADAADVPGPGRRAWRWPWS